MKKNTLTRKTKEELINIIFRKDDIEKKLQTNIANLRDDITFLEKQIEAKNSTISDNVIEIGSLREELKNAKESLKNAEQDCNDYIDELNNLKYQKLGFIIVIIMLFAMILAFAI